MSSIVFAVFDPTQDPRFRRECHSNDPQLSGGLRPGQEQHLLRQETLLKQASVQIRRYMGLSDKAMLNKPLIMVVPKCDIWHEMVQVPLNEEPYKIDQGGELHVNISHIEAVSDASEPCLPDCVRSSWRRLRNSARQCGTYRSVHLGAALSTSRERSIPSTGSALRTCIPSGLQRLCSTALASGQAG